MKYICAVIMLVFVFNGCAGYDRPSYDNGSVVATEPDMYLFGGVYDRGRDVHNYSHRGFESRTSARSGGKHAAVQTNHGKGRKR